MKVGESRACVEEWMEAYDDADRSYRRERKEYHFSCTYITLTNLPLDFHSTSKPSMSASITVFRKEPK